MSDSRSVHILGCEVQDESGEWRRADVTVRFGRIARIDPSGFLHDFDGPVSTVLSAPGSCVLPALHDHHIHLYALAAARASLDCGPARVATARELADALERADGDPTSPLRAVGYHESTAGELDRSALDALAPVRPVRLQHRTGALWMLNSAALDAAGLAGEAPEGGWPDGAELDARGRSTGRFFRLDDWLGERFRRRTPEAERDTAPDLRAVSHELARCGVASVTDATPRNDPAIARSFAAAQRAEELLQRVRLMGADGPQPEVCAEPAAAPLRWGERKIVLDERRLPSLEALAEQIERAHAHERSAAIHCVTRSELVLAAGALELAGVLEGDRIEHASIAPPDCVEWLARLGVGVVTQPGFIAERGDDYLRDVDGPDQPWLYRCAGFDRAGVALGGGTDAPYGDADPWRAMQAAVDRKTPAGHVLGGDERIDPERALALFTSPAEAPGGPPRRIAVGEIADLMVLDCRWSVAREHLDASHVDWTLITGRVVESPRF